MTKLFVLAKVGYDEFTIVGIYDSRERADAERTRVEEALVETGQRKHRRSRNIDIHEEFAVLEFALNKTRLEYIIRLRRDGQIAERHVFIGSGDDAERYERLVEGRADSAARAEELARAELARTVTPPAGRREPNE